MFKRLWQKIARALGFRPRTETLLHLDLGPIPKEIQAEKPRPPRETEAVLGLDFGTSCTKVVIRTPYVGGGQVFAVSFGHLAHMSSPYLLPTCLELNSDGVAYLPILHASPERWAQSLKLRLFRNPHDRDAAAKAACYLALVMRAAKDWFLRVQSKNLPDFSFRWSVNIGIPSAGYDDTELKKAFKRVAAAACILSLGTDPVSLAKAGEILDHSLELLTDTPVGVYPEIVAEVVAYARSPLRSNGLHLLADVGATTLDFCAFRLDESEGDDHYSLLTTLVEPLGVHQLHLRRIETIRRVGCAGMMCEEVQTLDLGDPLAAIPELVGSYLRGTAPLLGSIVNTDRTFQDRCSTAMRRVSHTVRTKKDRDAIQWKRGLPVFLCGGGGAMQIYGSALRDVSDFSTERYVDVAPFLPLLLPDVFAFWNTDIPEHVVRRLAVAYGLSFGALDIGSIDPPSLIPDIAPLPMRKRRQMIEKEHV